MHRPDILKLLLDLFLLAVVVFIRIPYFKFMESVNLLPRLESQIYYVVLATLIFTAARQIFILVYRFRNPTKKEDNVVTGIKLISQLIYASFVVVLFLSALNIDIKGVFTSLSLIAAAIALLTKDYISNMINGMIMAFSDLINIDDHVMIGDVKGRIQEITLTNVRLLTDDDDLVFVPNNMVLNRELTNYTKQEIKKSSIDFEVNSTNFSNIDELEARIIKAMEPFSADIQTDTYNLKVVQLKKDLNHLKFQYVLTNPKNKELERKIRRFCSRRLAQIINEN